MGEFAIFMGTLAVANLLPGPDMVMLVSTAAARGRRQAFAAALGLALARACHVTLAAVGLAQLLQASPAVFEAVKLAGAAYLVWIGVSVALAPAGGSGAALAADAPVGRSFGRGFLTNITNPKALIFLSVVLPQSVHPEAGSVYAQFALLGGIAVAAAFLFDLAYIGLATRAARLAPRSPRLARLQRLGMGSLLVAFSARLAFS